MIIDIDTSKILIGNKAYSIKVPLFLLGTTSNYCNKKRSNFNNRPSILNFGECPCDFFES